MWSVEGCGDWDHAREAHVLVLRGVVVPCGVVGELSCQPVVGTVVLVTEAPCMWVEGGRGVHYLVC
jgi:hypothetical protein